jgi:pyruvate formate lyase activating enzyme
MLIGGLLKFSMIDYPGKIAAIVFTQGCNLRCKYCHNPELIAPVNNNGTLLKEEDVLNFFEKRDWRPNKVFLGSAGRGHLLELIYFLEMFRRR